MGGAEITTDAQRCAGRSVGGQSSDNQLPICKLQIAAAAQLMHRCMPSPSSLVEMVGRLKKAKGKGRATGPRRGRARREAVMLIFRNLYPGRRCSELHCHHTITMLNVWQCVTRFDIRTQIAQKPRSLPGKRRLNPFCMILTSFSF